MPDEPSLGEIMRRLEDIRRDLKDDVLDVGKQVDGKVSQEVYQLRHEALMARVKALEELREKDADRIAAARRWLISAVIVPVVGVMVPLIVLLVRGAGP